LREFQKKQTPTPTPEGEGKRGGETEQEKRSYSIKRGGYKKHTFAERTCGGKNPRLEKGRRSAGLEKKIDG